MRKVLFWLFAGCYFSSLAAKECRIFKFHNYINQKFISSCDPNNIHRDTDRDGNADWKSHRFFGNLLVPNDKDIDGDGITNFLDPEPFIFNRKTSAISARIPEHLKSKLGRENRFLQQKLFEVSGKLAINDSNKFSNELLQKLIAFFETTIGQKIARNTPRLSYFIAMSDDYPSESYGYYLEPVDAIVIKTDFDRDFSARFLEVIAHEIGHALLFSNLQVNEFLEIAKNMGGWKLRESDDFYATDLFSSFSGLNDKASVFPSSYSYASPHEWFAENFAHYVLKHMNLENLLDHEMEKLFNGLLK